MRQGIAENEAEQGDAQAHREGAREERDVDTPVRRLPHHRAVGQAGQVDRRKIVPGGKPLAGRAQRMPGPDLLPGRIDLHQRVAPGVAGRVSRSPCSRDQYAAQPALYAVDPAGDLTDGPVLLRTDQFPGDHLECCFIRNAHAVPITQQGHRFGQRVGDHRVVDTAYQHRRQRCDERHADKRHQRQRQSRRAQARPRVDRTTHRDPRRHPERDSRSE